MAYENSSFLCNLGVFAEGPESIQWVGHSRQAERGKGGTKPGVQRGSKQRVTAAGTTASAPSPAKAKFRCLCQFQSAQTVGLGFYRLALRFACGSALAPA